MKMQIETKYKDFTITKQRNTETLVPHMYVTYYFDYPPKINRTRRKLLINESEKETWIKGSNQ